MKLFKFVATLAVITWLMLPRRKRTPVMLYRLVRGGWEAGRQSAERLIASQTANDSRAVDESTPEPC